MTEHCTQCGGELWGGHSLSPTRGQRYCLCRSQQQTVKAEGNKLEYAGKMVAEFSCPNCTAHLVVRVEEK